MNDVKEVLEHMGFNELRDAETGEWKPLDAVNGHYGTTDDTQLILPATEENVCRLKDPETGEELATARQSESVSRSCFTDSAFRMRHRVSDTERALRL